MNTPLDPTFRVRALLLGALLCLAACQSDSATTPTPEKAQASVSTDLSATAHVVALDPAVRRLTLRTEDGRLVDVYAGAAVRNYDQIAVGDVLRIRYQQSLTATLRPAGETPEPGRSAVVAGRAKPGEKPTGAVAVAASVRVRIESIDVPNDIVVFSLASGELITHRLATDEGRKFVKGLKIGDVVQLDYAEALALAIEELPAPQ